MTFTLGGYSRQCYVGAEMNLHLRQPFHFLISNLLPSSDFSYLNSAQIRPSMLSDVFLFKTFSDNGYSGQKSWKASEKEN